MVKNASITIVSEADCLASGLVSDLVSDSGLVSDSVSVSDSLLVSDSVSGSDSDSVSVSDSPPISGLFSGSDSSLVSVSEFNNRVKQLIYERLDTANFTVKQAEIILASLALDKSKQEAILSNIDFNKSINGFLRRKHNSTRTTYEGDIRCFLKWAYSIGLDSPVKITRDQAFDYYTFLINKGMAGSSIQRYLSVCRGLFDYIQSELNVGFTNPFKQQFVTHCKTRKREKIPPSSADIQCCLNWFESRFNDSKMGEIFHSMWLVLYYKSRYGLRTDSFTKINKIEGNKVTYTSKGHSGLSFLLDDCDVCLFKKYSKIWRLQGRHVLVTQLNRWLKKLYNIGVVNILFTSHLPRTTYTLNRIDSGVNLAEISRELGHKSLNSIDSYALGYINNKQQFKGDSIYKRKLT